MLSISKKSAAHVAEFISRLMWQDYWTLAVWFCLLFPVQTTEVVK